jgi:hypothetical protein
MNNKVMFMLIFISLMIHIDSSQAISAAAGPGVIIIDMVASQDFKEAKECNLVVQNTDIVPLQVHFSTQGDINNSDIIRINFSDNDFFLQPDSKQTILVSISAKAPGTYQGKILSSFCSVQESSDVTGSGVTFSASTKVTINVYGEQPSGSVANVTVHDISVNKPLVITAEFENTGNVVASPYFTAAIIKNNEIVDTISANSTEIPAYNKQALELVWDSTGQGTGNYTANIKIGLYDEILYNNTHKFMIVLQDSLKSTSTITHNSTVAEEINTASNKNMSKYTYALVIGIIIILLLVIIKQVIK